MTAATLQIGAIPAKRLRALLRLLANSILVCSVGCRNELLDLVDGVTSTHRLVAAIQNDVLAHFERLEVKTVRQQGTRDVHRDNLPPTDLSVSSSLSITLR